MHATSFLSKSNLELVNSFRKFSTTTTNTVAASDAKFNSKRKAYNNQVMENLFCKFVEFLYLIISTGFGTQKGMDTRLQNQTRKNIRRK